MQKARAGSRSRPEQACGPSANMPKGPGQLPSPLWGGDGGRGPLKGVVVTGHPPPLTPGARFGMSHTPSAVEVNHAAPGSPPASRAPPLPLVGRGWGWGAAGGTETRPSSAASASARRAESAQAMRRWRGCRRPQRSPQTPPHPLPQQSAGRLGITPPPSWGGEGGGGLPAEPGCARPAPSARSAACRIPGRATLLRDPKAGVGPRALG
jgi:hypothetical protein